MELDIEEKINIIDQHKKNIQYSKYNLEITLLTENAVSEPDNNIIKSITDKITDLNNKIAVLDKELASLK